MRNILYRNRSTQGLVYLLPTFALLSVILFVPLVEYGILLSFQEYSPGTPGTTWVGFEHYEYWLLGDGSSLLLLSIKMTFLYEIAVISLVIVLGLATALVFNQPLPARPFLRGLMIAAFATPMAAAAVVWRYLAHPSSYGVISNFLTDLGLTFGGGGIMSNAPWAFWIVVTAKVWRDFGFAYIIFLAGLQSIPNSLFEMAKADGAGPIQRFRFIILPHLRSLVLIVVVIRTVPTIANVVLPLGLTGGGPVNYTTFVGLLLFSTGFIKWELARAAALGMMLLAVLIPLIFLWVRLETEEQE